MGMQGYLVCEDGVYFDIGSAYVFSVFSAPYENFVMDLMRAPGRPAEQLVEFARHFMWPALIKFAERCGTRRVVMMHDPWTDAADVLDDPTVKGSLAENFYPGFPMKHEFDNERG